jgi:hypothetical protein
VRIFFAEERDIVERGDEVDELLILKNVLPNTYYFFVHFGKWLNMQVFQKRKERGDLEL